MNFTALYCVCWKVLKISLYASTMTIKESINQSIISVVLHIYKLTH